MTQTGLLAKGVMMATKQEAVLADGTRIIGDKVWRGLDGVVYVARYGGSQCIKITDTVVEINDVDGEV